jgi:murein DD-endopeptidase MepM/ murein hydrolase activator NlpD
VGAQFALFLSYTESGARKSFSYTGGQPYVKRVTFAREVTGVLFTVRALSGGIASVNCTPVKMTPVPVVPPPTVSSVLSLVDRAKTIVADLRLTPSEASLTLSHVTQLGLPIEKKGSLLRMEKGILDLTWRTVVFHTAVAAPFHGSYGVTQGFKGSYKAPLLHTGTDYGTPMYTPIYASANGVVDRVSYSTDEHGWGKVIRLRHFAKAKNGKTLYTQYAHLATAVVAQGTLLKKGMLLGLTGNTGAVSRTYVDGKAVPGSGAHLHFEVQDDRLSGFGKGYEYDPESKGYYNPVTFLASPHMIMQ